MNFSFEVDEFGIARATKFGTTVIQAMAIYPPDEKGLCTVQLMAEHGPIVGDAETSLGVNGVRVMLKNHHADEYRGKMSQSDYAAVTGG